MKEMLEQMDMDDLLPLVMAMGMANEDLEMPTQMKRLLDKGADPKRVFSGEILDGSASLTLSALTEVTVEDMRDEDCEEELHSEIGLAIVGVNFTDGMIELLKFLAEELSDSHKDYHVNMRFIESIQGLVEEAREMVENKEETDEEGE